MVVQGAVGITLTGGRRSLDKRLFGLLSVALCWIVSVFSIEHQTNHIFHLGGKQCYNNFYASLAPPRYFWGGFVFTTEKSSDQFTYPFTRTFWDARDLNIIFSPLEFEQHWCTFWVLKRIPAGMNCNYLYYQLDFVILYVQSKTWHSSSHYTLMKYSDLKSSAQLINLLL